MKNNTATISITNQLSKSDIDYKVNQLNLHNLYKSPENPNILCFDNGIQYVDENLDLKPISVQKLYMLGILSLNVQPKHNDDLKISYAFFNNIPAKLIKINNDFENVTSGGVIHLDLYEL